MKETFSTDELKMITRGRCIVERIMPQKERHGIILPTVYEEVHRGTVVKLGEAEVNQYGIVIEPEFNVGDVVWYYPFGATEFTKGKYMVHQRDIFAIERVSDEKES